MVPFGDFHISLRPNSFTRASSGVMVAHLTPTPTFLMALAASMVTWSLVLSRYSIPRSKYIRFTSRNGLISLSLMYCQMIRVISSPSSSTTGLVTLIFAMTEGAFLENRAFSGGWDGGAVAIAPENAGWKANGGADWLVFRRARNAVPASFAPCRAAWRGSPRRRCGSAGAGSRRCAGIAGRHASCGPDGTAPEFCATPHWHGWDAPRSRRAREFQAHRPSMRGAQFEGPASRHFLSSRSAKTSRPCLSATRIGHAITATVP